MATPRFLGALLVVAAVMGGCDHNSPPHNVLLISIDSLRADRLGVYGSGRETSPTLDRLAREGTLFERAISPTSWTLPSHVTLLSGVLPHHHGTVDRADRIRPDLPLLQEVFARKGYETVGFYSGPFLHPYYGFARGFEEYVSCETKPVEHPDRLEELTQSHDDITNPAVEAAFTSWLRKRSSRPFFAFVHMWDVHYDYIPPEPFTSMFDPDYRGKLDGRNITGTGFPDNASPRDVQHLLALYDGEVRYTDETVGAMLAALRKAGVLDDTLVVVTSDHGEEFREHGGSTHHRTVYVESVHVPLIFWAHRGIPRGQRVHPFVSLADVAPTILDLSRLEPLPPGDGRSLAPAMRGAALPPRPVLSAMFIPGEEWRRTLAVREGERSTVLWKKHDQWMTFDVRQDPGEHAPSALSNADREPLERYDAEVMSLLASRSPGATEQPALATTDPRGGTSAARATVDADRRPTGPSALPAEIDKRLRSLGYIQ